MDPAALASAVVSVLGPYGVDPRNFATSIALQLSRYQEYALALKDAGDKSITINVTTTIGTAQANARATGVVIGNLDVSRVSAQDAFNRVVVDPLEAIYRNGFADAITILVDSLDEALTHAGDVNIVKLLSSLETLPPQVRFILTSRREERVERRFPAADLVSLSTAEVSSFNHEDIATYVKQRLKDDSELSARAAAVGERQGITSQIYN